MKSYGFVIEPYFSVGSVLSRTVSTLVQKPVLFFGLAAVASLPSALINSTRFISPSAGLISFFINLLLGLLIQGAIAYGVFISLTGDEPSLGQVLARGFRRVFYLFLIILIIWILSVFLMFLTAMLIVMVSKITLLAVLMMFLMGVVATNLICSWAVTIQSCVVEQLGPIASINRSSGLTKGYRWQLFALFLILFVVSLVIVIILGTISSLVFPAHMLMRPQVQAGILFITSVFGAAFVGVMCSVIYYDLRAVKEGLTLDSLADIFD